MHILLIESDHALLLAFEFLELSGRGTAESKGARSRYGSSSGCLELSGRGAAESKGARSRYCSSNGWDGRSGWGGSWGFATDATFALLPQQKHATKYNHK